MTTTTPLIEDARRVLLDSAVTHASHDGAGDLTKACHHLHHAAEALTLLAWIGQPGEPALPTLDLDRGDAWAVLVRAAREVHETCTGMVEDAAAGTGTPDEVAFEDQRIAWHRDLAGCAERVLAAAPTA